MLIDRAQLLTLTVPEMTVLVGGLRVLGANVDDYFVNLLAMGAEWNAVPAARDQFEGRNRKTGELHWAATRVDLILGSNPQLRAAAEVYAAADADADADA